MRQALGPGALGRPRGIGRRGRWEGGSGWGTHVNPWLFHFNVGQNPLQYKKLKKLKKKNNNNCNATFVINCSLYHAVSRPAHYLENFLLDRIQFSRV